MQKLLRTKDEVNTTSVDARVSKTKARENTVRPLCFIGSSLICLVFVHASFLQNPGKIGTFFADRRLYIYI